MILDTSYSRFLQSTASSATVERDCSLEKNKTENMNILKEKIVFISGSRSGIGRSTALLMAKSGARLLLHCRKKGDCSDLIQEINQIGGVANEISGDISNISTIPNLTKSIIEIFFLKICLFKLSFKKLVPLAIAFPEIALAT